MSRSLNINPFSKITKNLFDIAANFVKIKDEVTIMKQFWD